MNWSAFFIRFYKELDPPLDLPNEIEWLHPQKEQAVQKIVEEFFHKFYNDHQQRRLLLGINPGRFGAGVTGVNFTAPRQLKEYCGIDHPFKDRSELSAEFIYSLINAYGGVNHFYQHYFIGSVCPLGFVRKGKNLNYYDDPLLLKTIEPFIIHNLEKIVARNVDKEVCFSIGGEKNFKYLRRLNEQFNWFKVIVPLAHPRFIMQYRLKQKEQFIQQYLQFIQKTY